ncbi:hypothetical protein [Aliarcobacter cryaerophilus]|uniref:hypothetical protein n=1 Tax=Aliarcobacter cryaerophilus TaxID=28198 RepID=UPI0008267496|nr:hypothetical protein [Aliarcobacter cryaerophilus]
MKKLKFILISIFIGFIFTGCILQPSVPSVSEEEVFKYEKQYLVDYENWKQQNKDIKPSFKWIQPKNKKEECKVYVEIDSKNDKTTKSDYTLYWDGECKDGYAYGLGREIEKTMLEDLQQIGVYENGKAVDYCTILSPLEGINQEGECSYSNEKANNHVKTIIEDKLDNFDIKYEIGVSGTNISPGMGIQISPFSDKKILAKVYPNFLYIIEDYTEDSFVPMKYDFNMKTKQNDNWINSGYRFVIQKAGGRLSGENINNGKNIRLVALPDSYINHISTIHDEIIKQVNLGFEAQKKALIIKEKYKKKICKDSVKVDFMDNSEYKEICNEDKKFADLKKKIDQKLAQIEQQKQAKRNQMNQQQLIQAQQAQTAIAQEREDRESLNKSLQDLKNSVNNHVNRQNATIDQMNNINRNMQMNRLNNNLNNINNNLNQINRNNRNYNWLAP